jgi:SAM-dependent methyltransferase
MGGVVDQLANGFHRFVKSVFALVRDVPDRSWQSLGNTDPYFAVLTNPRYHRDQLTPEAVRDFFASGEEYISWVIATIKQHFDPNFAPRRALDFGCGVGRLTIPLAARAGSVMGLDISEAMLGEARGNCANHGVENASFQLSDPELKAAQGEFDLIHSFIVFQHIPPQRGIPLFRRLLMHLDQRGVAVLHFTFGSNLPFLGRAKFWARKNSTLVNCATNVLKGRPLRQPVMQMNCYPLDKLMAIAFEAGIRNSYVHLTNHSGWYGAILFLKKDSGAAEF